MSGSLNDLFLRQAQREDLDESACSSGAAELMRRSAIRMKK